MINFFNFTRQDLASYLSATFELPKFRADQLFKWVYARGITDFSLMTDIKRDTREIFKVTFSFPELTLEKKLNSKDGSRKYSFKLSDGSYIESVFIKQDKRNTICISSQVGCAMNCAFCQTAKLGFKRNLEVSEIIGQVRFLLYDANAHLQDFTNIVFMGMGEPFLNYDNVVKAIDILNDEYGYAFSARKITVSTCGIVPRIKDFFEQEIKASLAVSLNATTNELRDFLMPINKKYPLEMLIEALKEVKLKGKRKITIEYVMLKGVNDTREDLGRLRKIVSSLKAKVNLVPYNECDENIFKTPNEKVVFEFANNLLNSKITTTIRYSKGKDIAAACGQLAGKCF
ncbi:MAG: 23S rRNA (adenine(2503)-C(2))-methyltransferase RlmN [Bdellovibrionota bacterium]